ncbi:MAG: hypothetical protein ACRDV6_00740 [Acidimicrobiales bacterium]
MLGLVLALHGAGHGLVVAGGAPGISSTQGSGATGKGVRGGSATTTTTPTTTATTTTGTSSRGASRTQKLGPPLSSTPYAQYAYELYPTKQTSSNPSATTGFHVLITPSGATVTVKVSASGSGAAPQSSSYPVTDRIYFVETSFGDDSGDSDYSFGDDGLLVTNSQGRLVR